MVKFFKIFFGTVFLRLEIRACLASVFNTEICTTCRECKMGWGDTAKKNVSVGLGYSALCAVKQFEQTGEQSLKFLSGTGQL